MKNKVIAILVGDMHITESQPKCRTDNFWDSQWEVVKFISDLQKKYNCKVLCSGDVFDHWKPSPYLLSYCIRYFPKNMYAIYGNHDLPQHNLDLYEKTGLNALAEANKIDIWNGCHWRQTPEKNMVFDLDRIKILMWHVMVWHKEKPYPNSTDPNTYRLIRKNPGYDVILTGHNHKPFTAKKDNTILVNPGSITRQTADQTDRPRVYLLHSDISIKKVYLPEPDNCITRDHLEKQKEKEKRFESFISTLNEDWEETLNYSQNLERFFAANNTPDSIKKIIYKSID